MLAEPAEELGGLGGRPHVGLADDLDERHAAPVVVDVGATIGVGETLVQRLTRVLFHVDARQADVLGLTLDSDVEAATQCERQLVLRDLIALRQVRIEVVLAREHRSRLDIAAARECGLDRVVDGLTIEHGKRAWQAQAHGTDLRVRRGAELGAAAAEDLRARLQLGVDFEADDGFPVAHRQESPTPVGPASLTEAATSFSKVTKLSTNIFASFFACSSYCAASGHVLLGSSTDSGTPGHDGRHLEIEDRMPAGTARCRAVRSTPP